MVYVEALNWGSSRLLGRYNEQASIVKKRDNSEKWSLFDDVKWVVISRILRLGSRFLLARVKRDVAKISGKSAKDFYDFDSYAKNLDPSKSPRKLAFWENLYKTSSGILNLDFSAVDLEKIKKTSNKESRKYRLGCLMVLDISQMIEYWDEIDYIAESAISVLKK